jgi:hypothetical protein
MEGILLNLSSKSIESYSLILIVAELKVSNEIQRILGHENRTTTEIYLHSISGSERAAIRVLERASEKKSLSKSLSENNEGVPPVAVTP